jgi:tripartite-type tricarboxylate transporter receptor subunit TctC
MSQEMNKIARDPALREHLFGLALTPQPGTPEELGALLRKDFERYGNLVRELNLRME